MSPHELKIKEDLIVILLCNLDTKNRLCIGTKLRIHTVLEKVLHVDILTSVHRNE